MTTQETPTTNIPEKLRRPNEPTDSKILFSTLIQHEGNLTKTELSEITGYNRQLVTKRWEKWDYDERISTYHEYLIQARAENSIKRINKLDNTQITQTEQINKIIQKAADYLEQHIDQILEKATPQQLLGLLRELPTMSNTNNNNARTAGEGLIDSLKYVTRDENTNLNITLPELQEILRGNYKILADAIHEQVEQQRQEKQEQEEDEEKCED